MGFEKKKIMGGGLTSVVQNYFDLGVYYVYYMDLVLCQVQMLI